ncbi:MAG: chorismate mutase [Rickettsiales bacterium]|nr:chorismate mutase [Rickettsiales bacterium]
MNLEQLRAEIDRSNKEIVFAIAKRFQLTRKVGELKRQNNLQSKDKSRELKVIENVRLLAKESGIDEDMIENIFSIVMKQVVKEHEEVKKNNG